MSKPDDTAHEAGRLRTLHSYELLDTAAEESFDKLVELAGIICETPISLISLVDESRQWFKARTGVDVNETPRDWAFCAHALQHGDLFVVPDASSDARFAHNPLVTAAPGIRFYAGAPLRVANGDVLGTLCVIDREPRVLSPRQQQALETLRDAVVSLIELRRSQADLLRVGQLLPMCAWCHSIRVETGAGDGAKVQWQPLAHYVASTNPVTHGICPACSEHMQRLPG